MDFAIRLQGRGRPPRHGIVDGHLQRRSQRVAFAKLLFHSRVLLVQGLNRFAQRRRLDVNLRLIAGQLAERGGNENLNHGIFCF